jgi:tetratricopeptide (TPR) repeat protein
MRYLILALAACSSTPPAKVAVAPPPPPPPVEVRFDEQVRGDFFDGLAGDQQALERAIALCEATLAKQPKHAEAMVWHGAGIIGRARLAFQAGDRAKGIALYLQGLAEMDAAVELAPRDVGVRIPRGAVVLAMAPHAPASEKPKLLERGISDYEVTLGIQQREFAKLSLHAREQLLYGLVDAHAHLGRGDQARAYYERMTVDAAGSELLARAASRSRGEAVDGAAPCDQCHQR